MSFLPRQDLADDPLCRVVLVEPLIPENTGNIARTCVGTESELHLIEPMGFEINETRVKRAGLDYWEHLHWLKHANLAKWMQKVPNPGRIFYIETTARHSIFEMQFQRGDWLVFGKETSGLEQSLIDQHDAQSCYLPMTGQTRSLNLSNSVAISVFELMRQTLSR